MKPVSEEDTGKGTMFDSKEKKTVAMPLLPLRDMVVFPHMIVPLFVGREKSIAALEYAMKYENGIFLVAQKNAKKDDPGKEDICRIGTIGVIIQLLRLPDGTVKVLVEGRARGVIEEYAPCEDYFFARVEEIAEIRDPDVKNTEALMRSIRDAFETYLKLSKKIHVEIARTVATIDDPSKFADIVISHVNVKLEDRQKVLEIFNINDRLEAIYSLIIAENEILQVEDKIKHRVKKQMEKTQRDYYLNEQMRAIQKEMGDRKSDV